MPYLQTKVLPLEDERRFGIVRFDDVGTSFDEMFQRQMDRLNVCEPWVKYLKVSKPEKRKEIREFGLRFARPSSSSGHFSYLITLFRQREGVKTHFISIFRPAASSIRARNVSRRSSLFRAATSFYSLIEIHTL